MRVAIDDAGHDVLPGRIDDLCIFRCFDRGAYFRDFAILNKDGAVFDDSVGNREDGGVLDQNYRRRVGRSGRLGEKRKRKGKKRASHCDSQTSSNEHGWNPHSAPPATDESLLDRLEMPGAAVAAACAVGLVPVNSIE